MTEDDTGVPETFDWLDSNEPLVASVVFAQSAPPSIEEVRDRLYAAGIDSEAIEPLENAVWTLRVEHQTLGTAFFTSWSDSELPPTDALQYSPWVTDGEAERITASGSVLSVYLPESGGGTLRRRKNLLKFAAAIMSSDGTGVFDTQSQVFWSAEGLRDELAHDGDVDLDSLYVIHAIAPDNDDDPILPWVHSHGLAQLGGVDFDLLNVHRDRIGIDFIRCIAFAVLEGTLVIGGEPVQLEYPDGLVRLVSAEDFMENAPAEIAALRSDDEFHAGARGVVCGPEGYEPPVFLQSPQPDSAVLGFSSLVSFLVGERARASYPLFRRYLEEFSHHGISALVKLGFWHGPESSDREYLWFEVLECGDDSVTGTLLNEPLNAVQVQRGNVYTESVSRLIDWHISTPAGTLTPRSTVAARRLRSDVSEYSQ